MQKILYISPIDWDWIKQRPQFLAEALAEAYEVHVLYRKQFNRRGLRRSARDRKLRLYSYRTLPSVFGRSRTLAAVSAGIQSKKYGEVLARVEPDWVWLTHPSQAGLLEAAPPAKLVYDCMDDYMLLGCTEETREELARQERMICGQADLVFASSMELAERLRKRYGLSGKLFLIRNGCPEAGVSAAPSASKRSKRFRLLYFGTISDWFDFDLIQRSLERFPNIEYELVGPRQTKAFSHDRCRYRGTLPHEQLWRCASAADCLVMPFINCEMVRAVDPVKMYEYISFQRNILCLSYPETQRFRPFASLYSGAEEYLLRLGELLEDNRLKYTAEQAADFLARNSWRQRAGQAAELMEGHRAIG